MTQLVKPPIENIVLDSPTLCFPWIACGQICTHHLHATTLPLLACPASMTHPSFLDRHWPYVFHDLFTSSALPRFPSLSPDLDKDLAPDLRYQWKKNWRAHISAVVGFCTSVTGLVIPLCWHWVYTSFPTHVISVFHWISCQFIWQPKSCVAYLT